MRRKNEGKLAEKQNIVYTTERALSFVFYGVGNKNAVIDAADKIKARNESGTFFITLDELMSCQSAVEHIVNDGHEIGIAYRATSDYPQGFDSVMSYINNWKKYAEWRYGINSDIVYMPFDKPSDETEEAINVSGCQLVGNTFIVVQNDDKEITLDGVPAALEKISHMRLMRGSFVCFNMSFYDNDKYSEHGKTIFGSVLDGFIDEHVDSLAYRSHDTGEIEDASRFEVKTVSEMLKSPEKYIFVNKKQNDITIDKNVLQNLGSEDAKFDFISEHYIGTSFVTSKNKLPGFTNAEISRMDTKGRFTDDKVLFLTFDDWGTEKSLNELLYVLEKNDVKATFFVTTQYVDSNPNMLRAIAVQGHQIGCHTDGHLPLSDSVEGSSNKAVTLTDEEAVALRKDVVTAYDKLYKYTGDVVVNGKQALSRMFRPPTLAVSRIGISQVFDVGYDYSVSGDMSTNDYKAKSYEDMVNQLKNGITDGGDHIAVHDGSIIVMHMLENAEYTAQALDYMIPLWKEQGYTFARLDDYLK